MQTEAAVPGPAATIIEGGRLPSVAYRHYATFILMVIYVLNFLDRQIITILAEPIKIDLHLADWELGILTGFSFALLYTAFGIPVARIADRGDRRLLITISVVVWSGFTATCGLAQNFVQLALARMGVGIGEAGCTPPALSLITEYTPREKRASALGYYWAGAPIGSLIGMILGGVLVSQFGWRTAFLVAGVPGILMGLVVLATIREPRRVERELHARQSNKATMRETLRVLWRKHAFRMLILAGACKAMMQYGLVAFIASFFFRVHAEALAPIAADLGLKMPALLGIVMGLIYGITGVSGTLVGGYLGDRLGNRDIRAYVDIPGIATIVSVPFYFLALTVSSPVWAFVLLALPAFTTSIWSAPSSAAIQGLAPPNMRATAIAVHLFANSLIGLGLGPLAVGATSDLFAGPLGFGSAEGLRIALLIFTLTAIPASLMYLSARRTIREETIE